MLETLKPYLKQHIMVKWHGIKKAESLFRGQLKRVVYLITLITYNFKNLITVITYKYNFNWPDIKVNRLKVWCS